MVKRISMCSYLKSKQKCRYVLITNYRRADVWTDLWKTAYKIDVFKKYRRNGKIWQK
jgi:hypothetical protein